MFGICFWFKSPSSLLWCLGHTASGCRRSSSVYRWLMAWSMQQWILPHAKWRDFLAHFIFLQNRRLNYTHINESYSKLRIFERYRYTHFRPRLKKAGGGDLRAVYGQLGEGEWGSGGILSIAPYVKRWEWTRPSLNYFGHLLGLLAILWLV